MTDSISRQFARWAANLTYEDLPSAVVDKVKAVILIHLVSGGIGRSYPRVRAVVDLTKTEDAKPDGATILGERTKVTRQGAAMANCEILHAAGLYDSYRMYPHAGPVLVAVALVNAELEGRSVREMITALAAGYEFECRLAHDFGPSLSAHGFRPAPVLSTMGATMVAAKLLGLDEDGIVSAIAIGASSASGTREAGRVGGGEQAAHEPNAARQGVFAAQMARTGQFKGSETSIEGDYGFLNTYAGSRDGRLLEAFTGPLQVDLASITEGLGSTYKVLDVMFRMYNTAGYNQPIMDLLTEMKHKHQFSAADVSEITVLLNYIETQFPSPDSAREYYAAHVAVNGGFPVVGGKTFGPTGANLEADQRVRDFMPKVRVLGVPGHPLFSPAIDVRMKSGMLFSQQVVYESMLLNYDQLVQRLQDCVPGLPGGQAHLDQLVATIRRSDEFSSVQPLFDAFVPA